MNVLGVDGAPNGWATIAFEDGRMHVRRISRLEELFEKAPHPDIVAVDVPIGLLDVYEIGGRECDRQARRYLKRRGNSVFVPPVRAVLNAHCYEEAKTLSRASSKHHRALSRQTWEIVCKIKEADELLRRNPHLRPFVREVHPEVCFCELVGSPMKFPKGKSTGRAERREALARVFGIDARISEGRRQKLPEEDVLDALVCCWSAIRLAEGRGRSLVADEKTIWV